MNRLFAQIRLAVVRVLPALFVPVALAAAMLAAPAPANAQILGIDVIQCAGTHQASWNPAVTNTAQLIDVTTVSKWTTCVDLTNLNQLLSLTASSTDNFQADFSCQSLLSQDPNSVTWTINWSNGKESDYTFSPSISFPDGNLVVTALNGKITSGYLNGYSVQGTFVLNGLANVVNNGCQGGVSGASGITTITLTPPLVL